MACVHGDIDEDVDEECILDHYLDCNYELVACVHGDNTLY